MLIEKSRWGEYLAELTRQAEGYDAAIEILSEELGDQVEVRRAPLLELSFDPRDGIAVAIGESGGHSEVLRHTIARPTSLEATDEPGVPSALMIEDEEGTKTLVRFAAVESPTAA
ncbi:MAG TPA: DUF5335 family protein [Solirubrobacter sp.]|nr:DUF5335 family protein [Solirubrobacter sp.]